MATTSFMIQLFMEQSFDPLVTTVFPLDVEAFLLLDPAQNTVVREIACEEIGGILASGFGSAFTIGYTSRGFVELKLLPPRGSEETSLFAPSHVASPPIPGMALAIMRVTEVGVTVDKNARLALARGIGAHAYVDQVT